jgi:hypothetical protein
MVPPVRGGSRGFGNRPVKGSRTPPSHSRAILSAADSGLTLTLYDRHLQCFFRREITKRDHQRGVPASPPPALISSLDDDVLCHAFSECGSTINLKAKYCTPPLLHSAKGKNFDGIKNFAAKMEN